MSNEETFKRANLSKVYTLLNKAPTYGVSVTVPRAHVRVCVFPCTMIERINLFNSLHDQTLSLKNVSLSQPDLRHNSGTIYDLCLA